MAYRERYDGKNVCNTQDDFNIAFQKAIKNNQKEDIKKNNTYYLIYGILYIVFLIWAIILAMRLPPGANRIMHLVFAMCCSPMYILAYYLGGFSVQESYSMGFRRYY